MTGLEDRPAALSRSRLPWIVAAPFSVSGVIHLVHPSTFTPIVPDFLPWPTRLVYASGVAELICAIGLWRRQRWAGTASAVLLVLIWPANLKDAISAQHGHNLTAQVLRWIRFPVQVPLVWLALRSGRDTPVVERPGQRVSGQVPPRAARPGRGSRWRHIDRSDPTA